MTSLGSCEKSLDLEPLDKYSETTFFKTTEQFKLFANQFYTSLPNFATQNTRDTYADILIPWAPSEISNGSYSPTPNSGLWSSSYTAIRNATYLVQKAGEAPENIKESIKVYQGEALFFRAMAYFNLLKDFGGVPIIDKVLDLDDVDLLYGPRDTREKVVDYIFTDINAAIQDLPLEASIPGNNKGRVSREAALALKARIALFEGTWRKFRGQEGNALLDASIEASGAVIDGNFFQLFDRRDVLGDDSYRYFFILDNQRANIAGLTKTAQNEYIFVNRYDPTIRATAGGTNAHLSPSASLKFANMFLCEDGLPIELSPLFAGRDTPEKEYENRDLRMTNVLQRPFTRFWAQTPAEYRRNWAAPNNGGNIFDINFGNTTRTGYYPVKFRTEVAPPTGIDYPVIRYAEVLLTRAEAMYERHGVISDEELDKTINALRARSNVAPLTNALVASHPGMDMRTEIRRERTVELFLEGFRFDDVRRWKTAEVELPQAIKGVLRTGTAFETDPRWAGIDFPLDEDGYIVVESAANRRFEPRHYLLPLPTRQILVNAQLVQNEGWD